MSIKGYFTRFELCLWGSSVLLITASFLALGGEGVFTLIASLIGVTSLIFCAKGNPLGHVLGITFSILYGIISFGVRYYGEMITYLGMTAPMAAVSLISWLLNPSPESMAEVKVNRLKKRDAEIIMLLAAAVTMIFYFILRYFGTANLAVSTLSVTTSFAASCLTFRRSAYFAVAYACNDIVLIVLWALAAVSDISCVSVLICFVVFLVNDLYGFVNWKAMEKRQAIMAKLLEKRRSVIGD